jgi:predicted CopG family antitoxin
MPYREGVTTIQISPKTREKLKALGKKGETYEDIILKLLEKKK